MKLRRRAGPHVRNWVILHGRSNEASSETPARKSLALLDRTRNLLAGTRSGSSPNALGTLGTRWTRSRYRSGLSRGPAAGGEPHRSSKPLTLSLAGSKEKNQENQKQPSRLHKTSRLHLDDRSLDGHKSTYPELKPRRRAIGFQSMRVQSS